MEYILPSLSLVVSFVAIYLSVKKDNEQKIIQQSVDLAERAQALNQKNGNKLTSSDKKNIAMNYAVSRKKIKNISSRIEAQVERRKRNA